MVNLPIISHFAFEIPPSDRNCTSATLDGTKDHRNSWKMVAFINEVFEEH